MILNKRLSTGNGKVIFIVALVIVLLPLVWVWLTLNWSYSEGERAGVLLKFSRKGWVCKTSEGELAQYVIPGVAPQLWLFTVRDDQVAEQLNKLAGSKMRLHYTEHRGVPTSCFGDTNYYVDKVTKLE